MEIYGKSGRDVQRIKIYDSKRKVELIRLKELVLDYMLNIGSEFGELYKERCFAAIADQIEEG